MAKNEKARCGHGKLVTQWCARCYAHPDEGRKPTIQDVRMRRKVSKATVTVTGVDGEQVEVANFEDGWRNVDPAKGPDRSGVFSLEDGVVSFKGVVEPGEVERMMKEYHGVRLHQGNAEPTGAAPPSRTPDLELMVVQVIVDGVSTKAVRCRRDLPSQRMAAGPAAPYYWLPRSQISIMGQDGRSGERIAADCHTYQNIVMPVWLAEQHHLVDRKERLKPTDRAELKNPFMCKACGWNGFSSVGPRRCTCKTEGGLVVPPDVMKSLEALGVKANATALEVERNAAASKLPRCACGAGVYEEGDTCPTCAKDFTPWAGESLTEFCSRVLEKVRLHNKEARVKYGDVMFNVKPNYSLENVLDCERSARARHVPPHLQKFVVYPECKVCGAPPGETCTESCDGDEVPDRWVKTHPKANKVRHVMSASPVDGCYCGICRHDRNADRVRNSAGETEAEKYERLAGRARVRAAEERPSLIVALPEGPRPKSGVAVMDEATLADLLCEEVEP